jgi:hypothetical protein
VFVLIVVTLVSLLGIQSVVVHFTELVDFTHTQKKKRLASFSYILSLCDKPKFGQSSFWYNGLNLYCCFYHAYA